MVLPTHEREAGAQLEQQLRYVLNHALLYIAFLSTLFGGYEVEDIGVFERLLRELAFWGGQGAAEVAHLAAERLTLVELEVDLMIENL